MPANNTSTYKQVETRIISRHDTAENWAISTLTPLPGEVIIYDPDYNEETKPNGFKYPRFKVGDGVKSPHKLPFAAMPDVDLTLDEQVDPDGNPLYDAGYFLNGFRIANDGKIEGVFNNSISGNAATADKLNSPYVLYPDADGYGDFTLNLSQGAASETESHSLVHINFPAYGDVNASASLGGPDNSIVDVELVAEEQWYMMESIRNANYYRTLSETVVTFTFNRQYLPENYTHFSMDLALGYGDTARWRMIPSCMFEISGELGADGLAWQAFRKCDENLNAYVREIRYDSSNPQYVYLHIRIGFKPDYHTSQSYVNTVASRSTVGCFPTAKYSYVGFYLDAEHLESPVSDFCISKNNIPKNLIPVDLDDWKVLTDAANDGLITSENLATNLSSTDVVRTSKLKGSGGTTVAANTATKEITISSPTYDIATSSAPGLVKSGGDVTVDSNGLMSVVGYSDWKASIQNKLDKLSYEYSGSLNCDDKNTTICIGKFRLYDSLLHIEITTSTSVSSHATLVIHSQNFGCTSNYVFGAKVFDDLDNYITPKLHLYIPKRNDAGNSGVGDSDMLEVYYDGTNWQKLIVHVKGVALKIDEKLPNGAALPGGYTKDAMSDLLRRYPEKPTYSDDKQEDYIPTHASIKVGINGINGGTV